ncbi:hypothetical protein [Lentzea albidocapillata]|uniref:hypothetical protein n=1 Tax=Lentzea albidocapillata TaxID=40571 RepID=UPI0015A3AEE4|nr:hypothetical protein [Lentzea albidocapillata]
MRCAEERVGVVLGVRVPGVQRPSAVRLVEHRVHRGEVQQRLGQSGARLGPRTTESGQRRRRIVRFGYGREHRIGPLRTCAASATACPAASG